MKNIKLYGLQRSGTNYIARLIEKNFRNVRVWHNGPDEKFWKHGPPQEAPGMDGYLLLVKNPFAWVVSYRKYMQDGKNVQQLCELYNTRLSEFLDFRAAHPDIAAIAAYESALEDLDYFLDAVFQFYKIEERAVDRYLDELWTMWRGGDDIRGKEALTNIIFKKSYYRDKEYLKELTDPDRQLIDVCINRHLLELV